MSSPGQYLGNTPICQMRRTLKCTVTGIATTCENAGVMAAAIAAPDPIKNHRRDVSMPIVVSYATTDEEAVAVHHFLCHVAGPILPGPIDPHDSIHEVWRVVNKEIALIAWREDGQMIGTVGLTRMGHWWNKKVWYLVNRWAFIAPGSRCWKPLLTECRSLARDLGVECTIVSEKRQRLTTFNKSKLRG